MSDGKPCNEIVEDAIKKHVDEYHTHTQTKEWFDMVLHEDRKEFIRQEASYCQGALRKFYMFPEGDKKEEAREVVLSRRKDFLKIWCETNNCR